MLSFVLDTAGDRKCWSSHFTFLKNSEKTKKFLTKGILLNFSAFSNISNPWKEWLRERKVLFGRRAVRAAQGKRRSNVGAFKSRTDVAFASWLKAEHLWGEGRGGGGCLGRGPVTAGTPTAWRNTPPPLGQPGQESQNTCCSNWTKINHSFKQ